METKKFKNYCLIIIVLLTIIVTILAVYWFLTSFIFPARFKAPKQTLKDGRLAMFINKYHKTLKCLANIIDDYTENLDPTMACCRYETFNTWLYDKTIYRCPKQSPEDVAQLVRFLTLSMDEKCLSIDTNTFACQMMFFMVND